MKDILRLLLSIGEASEDYFLLLDDKLKIIWANKAFEKRGIKKIKGKNAKSVVEKQYFDYTSAVYALKSNKVRKVMRNGTEIVTMPLELEGKRYAIVFSALQKNISVAKNIQKTLKYDEGIYKSVLDNMIVGCQIIGFDWKYLYLNDVLEKQSRTTREKLLGHTMMEKYPGIEKTEVFRKIKICMIKRISQKSINEFKFSDGSISYFEVKIVPIAEGVLILSDEITDQKKAQEALLESEEKYHSLFKNMFNGFAFCKMIYDRGKPVDFTYLDVNKAFEALTGLKDVVGKKVSVVIPGIQKSNPELFETYGRVALSGVPERFETHIDSLGMWFSISVYSQKKEHFVALFDVITQRKKAEEEKDMLTNKLKERIHDLERFQNITVNRELKMIELKNKIKALEKKGG